MTESSFSLVPQGTFLQADSQDLSHWQEMTVFLLLRSLLFQTHHCFDVLLHILNTFKVRNAAYRNTCSITILLADLFLLLYHPSNTAVFETKPCGIWGPSPCVWNGTQGISHQDALGRGGCPLKKSSAGAPRVAPKRVRKTNHKAFSEPFISVMAYEFNRVISKIFLFTAMQPQNNFLYSL